MSRDREAFLQSTYSYNALLQAHVYYVCLIGHRTESNQGGRI